MDTITINKKKLEEIIDNRINDKIDDIVSVLDFYKDKDKQAITLQEYLKKRKISV